ncbi:19080_t:CDS:2, partial [Dentiscutata erythropus]
QLGYSFNTSNNLEFKSNNSIIPSLTVLPEKVLIDILQPLSLNYIYKKIPLQLPNSNNPLLLVYYEAITSSSDALPFYNKTSLENSINVTSPSKNQQHFLTNNNPIKYAFAWKRKIPEYKYNENNSDADSEINEIRKLIKLKKKKLKSLFAKCLYDLAGNAYF